MGVFLTNKSRQLLIVKLNSGVSVHLAPKERSRRIEELEIVDNFAVAKMSTRGLLAVEKGI